MDKALYALMNSPILWALSALMVIGIIGEAVAFVSLSFKNGPKLGVTKEEMVAGMRTAMITAIGPSLAPVITLIALMAVIGGPTGWMRMNDIGAARTELAMCAIASEMAGASLTDPKSFTITAFVFCLWGMAMNNSGWMVVGGYGAPFLNGAVEYLKNNYNPKWVKLITTSASLGLFGTLLCNAVVKKGINKANLCCALVAFVMMIVLNKLAAGNKRLAEFSLGISMLIGMFVAAALF